jgi:UDP-N-acetylglucosamine--N-acetylmuramyl-(pentapeptide) pyrophosphoryl-undecaprenol N-acetylglucosamine transferase
MHVVLAGGGTAGHIEPALALADALRRRDARTGITALGTARGLESRLVPARGYDLALIPPVPLPRRLTPSALGVPRRVAAAVAETARVLDRVGADVVVGFGGYVAAPAYLAARRRGIPIVVHEANARPGLANRLGARLTRHVAVSTPGSTLRGAVFLGLPLRRAIATLDRAATRTKARAELGLDPQASTLLVTGGSQGARRINTAASGACAALSRAGVQVLHATGPAQSVQVAPEPGGAPYVVVPYIDRMDLAYAAVDLVLCRAGAMTVAELTAVGLPAAYVPLPIGNGEQRLNAEPVVRAGGGLMVADADCTPDWVAATLLPLLGEPTRLGAMGAAAAALGRRDADERLADLVLSAAAQGPAARDVVPL